MGGPGFTEKRVRIEEKNQYTFIVESGSTRTEIKYWVECLFGVKVRGMNSHRLLRKGRRMRPSMGHKMHYRRLIITLQPGYSIPPLRRMGLAKHFIRTNVEPKWMVLCLLPVLPPGLRPAVQIGELKRMSSDINDLYGRVLSRNNDLLDLLTVQSTPGDVVMSQERFVQEALDTLFDNGIRGEPIRDGHNKVYKSFTDLIEGKEGRFRETLVSKRVDYSGRSVIVIGPSLSLHQCALPREIAIEFF